MVTYAVALPPVLVAVIVYELEEVTSVGVPLISPVEVSKVSPVGSVGDMAHVTTVPPLDVGVAVVIAVPLVKVNGLPLNVTEDGATSLTVIVTDAVSVPPVFDTVMV